MTDHVLLRSSPHAEPFLFHQLDPCAILFAQLLQLSLFSLTCIALLGSKHPGNIILWGAARVGMANRWHRCRVWYRRIFRVAPEICMEICK
jgi:hypothetical protein